MKPEGGSRAAAQLSTAEEEIEEEEEVGQHGGALQAVCESGQVAVCEGELSPNTSVKKEHNNSL